MTCTIIQNFRDNIIDFVDELVEQFPNEPDFIMVRLLLNTTISAETILTTFIKEILPYKADIAKRDETLFMESRLSFFGSISNQKKNHFKMLWKSDRLNDDDKETIWAWLDTFIFLVEQYQKAKESELIDKNEK